MKNQSLLPILQNKDELLSEMDSLMILGGKDGTGEKPINAILSNCDSKNEPCQLDMYCNGGYCGNCVANCGGLGSFTPNP